MATLLKRMVDTDNSLKDDYINRDIQVKNQVKQDLNIKNDNGIIKDLSGNILKQQATAWVSFSYDGSNIAIQDSYNISSVTRLTTGSYKITFDNEMDNHYYIIATISRHDDANNILGLGDRQNGDSRTTTDVIVQSWDTDNNIKDIEVATIVFFGGRN